MLDGGYAVLAGGGSNDGDMVKQRTGNNYILRINASGDLLWQNNYGTSQSDGSISMAITPDGGYIMLTCTNGTDGDAPFHYGDHFSFDWLVIKTDALGNVQWSKNIGGSREEQSVGKILSVGESYYIASGSSSRDHDCADNAWHGVTETGDDAYLLKLDNTGNVLWAKSYGGSNHDVFYDALYDERDNTLVMTGVSDSKDYMCMDQHGEGDMLTIKTDRDGNVIWHKCLGGKSEDDGMSIIKRPEGGYLICGNTSPAPDTTSGGIGYFDNIIYVIDNVGNNLSSKIFGGTDGDKPSTIVSYGNGYAVCGVSGSKTFTEGTYNMTNVSGAFISFLGNGPLEVKEPIKDAFPLSIYPDPARNKVMVKLSTREMGSLTVFNSVGQRVYYIPLTNSNNSIEISDWSAGIYTVYCQGATDGKTRTAKFIKK